MVEDKEDENIITRQKLEENYSIEKKKLMDEKCLEF